MPPPAFPRWYEHTFVEHFCGVWRCACERELLECGPGAQKALLRGCKESFRHLCWPWWLSLVGPLADDLRWLVMRKFLRGFPVVYGMPVQEYGNRIEISSRLTNRPITLLSHRGSIGQMNWVCGIVISLFCWVWKGNSILKQGQVEFVQLNVNFE